MPVINCEKCDKSVLKPHANPPELCADCTTQLQTEINKIDRNEDRYTKRGKLKNRLQNIPDKAIPQHLALQIEEVADPKIDRRNYCIGTLDELTQISDTHIRDINNDYTELDRGKVILR